MHLVQPAIDLQAENGSGKRAGQRPEDRTPHLGRQQSGDRIGDERGSENREIEPLEHRAAFVLAPSPHAGPERRQDTGESGKAEPLMREALEMNRDDARPISNLPS